MSGVFTKLVALGMAAAFCPLAQTATATKGSPDPIFASIPFDRWFSESNQARIRWSVQISDPVLSSHQRLSVDLDVQVDGTELARRRGEGRFLVLLQLIDKNNQVWQNHQELDLDQVEEAVKASNAVFAQSFFIVPGDYRVSVAVFDTATGEHSVIKRSLHVSSLRNDPLPDMWRDLPAVEFLTPDSSFDRWYLPSIEGRLRLLVETQHPVDVDLLVNLTPAERLGASTQIQNRNLEALIPATKVLSQVEWRNARLNLELLDLERRRVAYRQDNMQALDWSKARVALDQANPAIIDVRSLRNRKYSADYFLNRISRKIGPADQAARPPHVVIVLSASVFFEPGVEMHPIAVAPRPDVTVIYIRYQPQPPIFLNPEGRPRRLYATRGGDDELEPLLKPLAPRLYEVATPEQFRRSLAAILGEIARM